MDAQMIINGLAAEVTELRGRLEQTTAELTETRKQRDAALEQIRTLIPDGEATADPVPTPRARKATKSG